MIADAISAVFLSDGTEIYEHHARHNPQYSVFTIISPSADACQHVRGRVLEPQEAADGTWITRVHQQEVPCCRYADYSSAGRGMVLRHR